VALSEVSVERAIFPGATQHLGTQTQYNTIPNIINMETTSKLPLTFYDRLTPLMLK
jgi:hypothetical protein